jgi:DNA-binding MarR family transcriptional regulator
MFEGTVSKPSHARTELLRQLEATLRTVGAQSVLLSGAVARLVGLNSTDLECLDLLDLAGTTTAGHLAKHAGLTTGAMTAVIDRLERAGFVRRLPDPEDRRCVRVEALPRSIRRIGELYRRLSEATAQLNERYDDRQLAVVVDYLSRAHGLAAEHVVWLQTQSPQEPAPTRPRKPVRGTRRRPSSRVARA